MPRNYERETLLKAIEILTSDEEREKDFVEKYKNLRKTFELLGPDEVKLEYFEDYKWLSSIYTYYMKVVIQKPVYGDIIQKYYDKTIRFIHKATEINTLEKDLPIISFDSDYLKKLEDKVKNKKEKAVNILFALNRLVLVERHRNPIYESLVEKVERLLELWKEKTKDYKKIYFEGSNIFQDITTLSERQKSLGFSDTEYAILLELEKKLDGKVELISEVKNLSKQLEQYMFSGWINQTTVKKEAEREIRKFVRGIKTRYNLSFDEMNDLHEKLVESVKNYGTA